MKIRYKELNKALEQLRYKAQLSDHDVYMEVTMREEDPGNGILGECMLITLSVTKKPGQYDDCKGVITTDYSLEVFAEGENRAPRMTTTETRELDVK